MHLIDLHVALVLPLKSPVNHKPQDILLTEYYRDDFKKNSHCKTCAAFLLVLGIFSIKQISLLWFMRNSFVMMYF